MKFISSLRESWTTFTHAWTLGPARRLHAPAPRQSSGRERRVPSPRKVPCNYQKGKKKVSCGPSHPCMQPSRPHISPFSPGPPRRPPLETWGEDLAQPLSPPFPPLTRRRRCTAPVCVPLATGWGGGPPRGLLDLAAAGRLPWWSMGRRHDCAWGCGVLHRCARGRRPPEWPAGAGGVFTLSVCLSDAEVAGGFDQWLVSTVFVLQVSRLAGGLQMFPLLSVLLMCSGQMTWWGCGWDPVPCYSSYPAAPAKGRCGAGQTPFPFLLCGYNFPFFLLY